MRTISEAEMWFNAVERVNHYSQLPSEPYRAEDGEEISLNIVIK